MTLAQAAGLLNEAENPLAKMNAVWNLWGYRVTKKAPTPPGASRTGGASTTASAEVKDEGSATKTSAD
jgi:hypothetical protein